MLKLKVISMHTEEATRKLRTFLVGDVKDYSIDVYKRSFEGEIH